MFYLTSTPISVSDNNKYTFETIQQITAAAAAEIYPKKRFA